MIRSCSSTTLWQNYWQNEENIKNIYINLEYEHKEALNMNNLNS